MLYALTLLYTFDFSETGHAQIKCHEIIVLMNLWVSFDSKLIEFLDYNLKFVVNSTPGKENIQVAQFLLCKLSKNIHHPVRWLQNKWTGKVWKYEVHPFSAIIFYDLHHVFTDRKYNICKRTFRAQYGGTCT